MKQTPTCSEEKEVEFRNELVLAKLGAPVNEVEHPIVPGCPNGPCHQNYYFHVERYPQLVFDLSYNTSLCSGGDVGDTDLIPACSRIITLE